MAGGGFPATIDLWALNPRSLLVQQFFRVARVGSLASRVSQSTRKDSKLKGGVGGEGLVGGGGGL